LAKSLRDGLTKIRDDNLIAPDPTGEVTRTKLSVIFEAEIVDRVMGLVSGTAVCSTVLSKLPDALARKDSANHMLGIDPSKMPTIVRDKISYDPKTTTLNLIGGMTTDDEKALLNTSNDGPYQTAITNIFQQPVALFKNAFGGIFTDPEDAAEHLIR